MNRQSHVPNSCAQSRFGTLAATLAACLIAFAALASFPAAAFADTTTLALWELVTPTHAWVTSVNTTPGGTTLGDIVISFNGTTPEYQNFTLTFNNSVSGNSVAAGASDTATVNLNKLIITTGADQALFAIGGVSANPSQSVTVTNNQVSVAVLGTTTIANNGGIYGGLAQHGPDIAPTDNFTATVTGNFVVFEEGYTSTNADMLFVIGGQIAGTEISPGNYEYAGGNASGNYVKINAGASSSSLQIDHLVGASVDGSNIAGQVVASSLTGNYVEIQGDATSGTLQIDNSVFGALLTRGMKDSATGATPLIQGNYVKMERGTVSASGTNAAHVVGGYGRIVDGATIQGNTVQISGTDTKVYGSVLGGGVDMTQSVNSENTAQNNEVYMRGGLVSVDVTGGQVTGGMAQSNKAYVSGGQVLGDVYGGHAQAGSATVKGKAIGNFVSLSGGADLQGRVFGGYSDWSAADGNEIQISGLANAVDGVIYGGYSNDGGANGTANNNRVSVMDSHVANSIYGGMSFGSGGDAVGNTLSFGGKITLDNANVDLYGGAGGAGGDKYSRNTLTLDNVDYQGANKLFRNLSGFNAMNVNVTSERAMAATVGGGGDALIPAAGTVALGPTTDPTVINAHITGAGALPVGAEINIFESSATMSGTGVFNLTHNLSFYYGTLDADSQAFTVAGRAPLEEAKVLSELPLADISFVNRGADFIASQAIPSALASVSGNVGVAAFATVGYGWSRTETGSHIDVKGVSGDVGVAFATETSAGPFAAGAFLEFGDGTFDSYNDFAGIPTVHGEGDVNYIGGGVFARMDVGQADASHPYFEASVRFGKTDAEFKTRDFVFLGREIRYDMDAKYWGFHAGGGYIIDFDSFDGSLDLSAKYFHTHRDGDEFFLDGDRVSLSSVTSSRIKVGGRLSAALTRSIKGYFGLYFEHEFDGDSVVTYAGMDLPKSTLGGSSGVGELGVIVAAPDSPVEVQLGVQGSAGRRDGISANLSFKVTF
ncbi:MAG: autotransporter outer membrane beta-barrel domain-containing protein [Deltaproteobacteria bacterium]|nr:autotransporter outer membrane beta-barrel domain-containing protein [Deltaproteobacteria bacterium]